MATAEQPIIEATEGIRFGCFRGSYFQMPGQFSSACISPYNNNWGKIHDFTPVKGGGKNYSFLDQAADPSWLADFYGRRPEAVQGVEMSGCK